MKKKQPSLSILNNSFFLSGEKNLIILLIIVMILFALSEGAGIGLIAPLLESNLSKSPMSKIPYIGWLSGLFANNNPSLKFIQIGVTLTIILILRGGLQFLVGLLSQIILIRISKKISKTQYRAAQGTFIDFIQKHPAGMHVATVLSFSDGTAQAYESLAKILSGTIVLLAYLFLMVAISWELTVISIVFLSFLFFGQRILLFKAVNRASNDYNQSYMKGNSHLIETFSGAMLVRSRVAETIVSDKFGNLLDIMKLAQLKKDLLVLLPRVFYPMFAGMMISGMIIGFAILKQDNISEWIPVLILFIIILFRLLSPVTEIAASYTRLISDLPSIEQVNKYLQEARESKQNSGAVILKDFTQEIRFEKVYYSYPDKETNALSDISFSLKKASRTAIVGPSGAGKSTIVSLIGRYRDVLSGQIFVDGNDLRDLDVHHWRCMMGFVSQESFFFNDTVRNNLEFGLGHLTEYEIFSALEKADARTFVEELPHGLDTVIGDRGVGLSGGQRQRLGIAQALIGNPSLLFFDEATSQLDSITQNAIHNAMKSLPKDMTILVIAHRLSTVQEMEEIIVLDNGSIVERGNHQVLMRKPGIYRQMVDTQVLKPIELSDAEPENM